MKRIITLVFPIIFIVSSCFLDHSEERRWSEFADQIAPLTDNEKEIVDSLARIGYNCSLEHTFIGRQYLTHYNIGISLDSNKLYPELTDSIRMERFRNRIIDELYRQVISDSLLYEIHNFRFYFEGHFNEFMLTEKFDNNFSVKKDLVAKRNHFHVIKNGGHYLRVVI